MVSLFLKECDRQTAMTFSLFGDKFTRHAGIT
ncbi:Valine--pyruvate aminotransferase, partial [Cronobacter sakazakii]